MCRILNFMIPVHLRFWSAPVMSVNRNKENSSVYRRFSSENTAVRMTWQFWNYRRKLSWMELQKWPWLCQPIPIIILKIERMPMSMVGVWIQSIHQNYLELTSIRYLLKNAIQSLKYVPWVTMVPDHVKWVFTLRLKSLIWLHSVISSGRLWRSFA